MCNLQEATHGASNNRFFSNFCIFREGGGATLIREEKQNHKSCGRFERSDVWGKMPELKEVGHKTNNSRRMRSSAVEGGGGNQIKSGVWR